MWKRSKRANINEMRACRAQVLCPLILTLAGCTGPKAPVPDVVFLIVIDTLRADRLSCYGYDQHRTPAIDDLARSGVLFVRAQAAASWTVPSMGAMLTSRYPTQLGLIEKPLGKKHFHRLERRPQLLATIPQRALTMAERLKEAGFRTTGFVNQPFLNVHEGFVQGFDAWCYPNERGAAWHDLDEPFPTVTRVPAGVEGGQADSLIVEAFVDWTAQAPEEGQFVWIHLLRPHSPYIPPKRFMVGHPGDGVSAAYDGEVRAADAAVGRMLDAIERRFSSDRTMVILTSDHGEEFGEHCGSEHGHSLHSEVTHVPLIIRAPGLPAGRTVNCRVRTIDILPTVLDLVAVPGPLGIEGRSLLDTVNGGCGDRPTYAEGMLYEGTERSLIEGEFRLMYEIDTEERYALFDLSADPGELADVSEHHGQKVEGMREDLLALHARLLQDLQAGLLPADTTRTPEESERILRSLKALGYIK